MFHSGKFCHDFRKYILWNSFVVNSLVLDSHGKWIHFLKLIWLNTLAAVNNQLIWNASIDNTPSLISFWAETLYIIIATYHLNLKFSVSNFWETAKKYKVCKKYFASCLKYSVSAKRFCKAFPPNYFFLDFDGRVL